jgi:hypothetical protein
VGSEATLAVRLHAHLAAAALAQVDLVVVLQALLRVQEDPTVALRQVGRREADPVPNGERLSNRPAG